MKKLKKIREQKVKMRKNFFPALILTSFSWGFIFLIIYFLSPESIGIILLFFIFLFISLFLTLSLIFTNTRRGGLVSCGLILFILLRYFGVGNILNFLLILGIVIATDFYLSKSKYWLFSLYCYTTFQIVQLFSIWKWLKVKVLFLK